MSEPFVQIQWMSSASDRAKEFVPMKTVLKFPTDWKVNGWDRNYLYKVFWSPEDETADELLQRTPSIPVFEVGTSGIGHQAGYYRAIVLAAADSEEELKEDVEKKRISISMAPKYTSFDLGRDNASGPSSSSRETSKEGKGEAKKPLKKSGVNRTAQVANVNDLRGFLPKNINETRNIKETEDGPLKSDGGRMRGKTSAETDKKRKRDEEKIASCKKKISDKMSVSHTASPKLKRAAASGVSYEESDEDSNEVFIKGNKVKIDPDFTPKKMEEAKTELALKQRTIEKLTALNARLNKSLDEKEKTASILQQKYDDMEERLLLLEKSYSQADPHMSDNMEINESSVECILDTAPESQKKLEDHLKYFEEADAKCADLDDQKSIQSSPPNNPPVSRDMEKELSAAGKDVICDKALIPGVEAPPDVWEYISSAKAGEKGDLFFIKSLVTVVFGPEVLSASSIKGTKRGQKNKRESAAEPRPALDPILLCKVRDCFRKRVGKEEYSESVDRTSDARFQGAIRQVQKKYRGLGYGKGTKGNDVSLSVLTCSEQE